MLCFGKRSCCEQSELRNDVLSKSPPRATANCCVSVTTQMSIEEFKRQVQNHFAVALSWDEVRALKKIYGDPGER